jgi:hypothetical protein
VSVCLAFRDLFNRVVTDSKNAGTSATTSGPSLQVTPEILAVHNPTLPADSFESLKHLPHLGVPPSLCPLFVPVHDDQPSSIIAYTLASLEHLLTVGRIRRDEIKILQQAQSWMAHEEEQAINISEENIGEDSAVPITETPSVSPPSASDSGVSSSEDSNASAPPITKPSPPRVSRDGSQSHNHSHHADGIPTPAQDDSVASTHTSAAVHPSTVSGIVAPTVALPSASTLHHSFSEHHVSFLFPNSLQHTMPHRAPPPVPQHLTAPSLLGFDPIRDRADIVEATMTKFSLPEGAGGVAPPPSQASSHPASISSTDHAQHLFKYQFEDTGSSNVLHHHEAPSMTNDPTHAHPAGTAAPNATPHMEAERTTFRCTVYFPRHFHALRLMTCGGDYEFIQSLCHCTSWSTTGGKSGASFLKTSDERFILKFISRTELKMFLESAHRYFAYMAKNVFHALPSFLVKILGVYQLSWKKHNFKRGGLVGTEGSSAGTSSSDSASSLSSQYVLVMPNLFFARTNSIEKIFDLKGSARNRYIKRKNRDENRVLLDENLMECQAYKHTTSLQTLSGIQVLHPHVLAHLLLFMCFVLTYACV